MPYSQWLYFENDFQNRLHMGSNEYKCEYESEIWIVSVVK